MCWCSVGIYQQYHSKFKVQRLPETPGSTCFFIHIQRERISLQLEQLSPVPIPGQSVTKLLECHRMIALSLIE